MSNHPASMAGTRRTGIALVVAMLAVAFGTMLWWTESAKAEEPADDEYVLMHVDSNGNIIKNQDLTNNVRGARHVVCLFRYDDDGSVSFDRTDYDPVSGELTSISDVHVTAGGGYTSVNDPDPTFTDPALFTATALTFNNDEADAIGADCLAWVSTEAGDQEITAEIDLDDDPTTPDTQVRSGAWDRGASNKAVIKEWNVLEHSCISVNGTQQNAADGSCAQNVTLSRTLVPTGIGASAALLPTITDGFYGSHVTRTGTKLTPKLSGVIYNVSIAGCGSIIDMSETSPGTGITGTTDVEAGIGPVFLVSNFNADPHYPSPDDPFTQANENLPENHDPNDLLDPVWYQKAAASDCFAGGQTVITITGSEPSPLGSGTGKTVTETITINWTVRPAHKAVMLAWAGQRIVLEHDWRLPPGDYADGDEVGVCLYDHTIIAGIKHVKGGGPGNFINGVGALNPNLPVLPGPEPDSVIVPIFVPPFVGGDDQFGDIPLDPQDSCISRVLFESEQPGQVDIEAFAVSLKDLFYPVDDSKVAFVIYYMKIENVDVSLVSQVSKPTHNGSWPNSTGTSVSDYSPGNPWDASKDDADDAVDWNVSKDILVRVRVRGWFRNENPSGRAADTTNPLNVLPADRWVMPNDWAILAGGPADPADGSDAVGTAETFRPYYDIMIAPNNTRGLSLSSPRGGGVVLTTTVTTVSGLTNSATTFGIASANNLAPNAACDGVAGVKGGSFVVINTETREVKSIQLVQVSGTATGVSMTLCSALSATPAAGSLVLVVSGVPFEGPMSLIDIPGLAGSNNTIAGAAAGNWSQTAATRDTILQDGDVDWWDAPMPPAQLTVSLRGTGFIKQVLKEDVYYNGTANSSSQLFPNPFYYSNIPDSPFIPAQVVGGGYLIDSWGNDGPAAYGGAWASFNNGAAGVGPYHFWVPVRIGTNPETGAIMDPIFANASKLAEILAIQAAYADTTIARDLTLYTDNHGEAMVTANGDFNTDLSACATNILGGTGGKHCKIGDVVGKGTITATADYPDFRGKHPPVLSNTATVTWTWGGYKDVTVEAGEDPQFKYIVFHALDRDGFCYPPTGGVSLHPVLSGAANDTFNGNPAETVDFLIDSGQGIILSTSGGAVNTVGNRQFATGVTTFSTAVNTTLKEFPLSSQAPAGATDECQAWIKVSNSLLGILNVLVIAHDDEGDIGFDRIVDLQNTAKYTLNFRWSLITWNGADNISVSDALKGTGANDAGNDIFDQVTAVYGWDAAAQDWLGFFPDGVAVPGANDLVTLKKGAAYWIAIKGPSAVEWTIATNVG